MSDHISKSAMIKAIENHYNGLTYENVPQSIPDFYSQMTQLAEEQPTLDEKEIIRKPLERILERVEKARQKYQRLVKEQGEKEDEAMNIHFRGMMNIVKEEGGIE